MDNPLVQVLVLLYGTLSVTGVFLGDILVSFIDPRIKLVDSND
jgi:ABC-type dipeptide/oligopeptide/nickel transport system permease component